MMIKKFMTLAFLPFFIWGCATSGAEKQNATMSSEVFGAAYPRGKANAERAYGETRLRTKVTWQPNENFFACLEGDIVADTAGFTKGVFGDIYGQQGRRSYLEAREAYLEFRKDWLKVKAGKQIVDWSVTDTISPFDFFSPRDWTDVVRWERVGVPAVDLRFGHKTYLEVVYTPFFTPSKLPVAGGRWDRNLPTGFGLVQQETPGTFKNQIGIRAGTTVKEFDLRIGYYNGYGVSPTYGVRPTSLITADLVPSYHHQQAVTFAAVRGLKGFTFRFETGHVNQQGDDSYIPFVFGVERLWQFKNKELFVLLQYANEVITRQVNPLSQQYDFRRALNNALMWKTQLWMNQDRDWGFKLEGAYNFRYGGLYLEPAVFVKIKKIYLEAGYDLMSGPRDSFFGGWSAASRVFTKVKCTF